MNILAIDDEFYGLEMLKKELNKVFLKANIEGFNSVTEALEYIEDTIRTGKSINYAFLDIRLRGMTGIELAKIIKEKSKETKIIFCTGYSEYACEAFQLYALGYLLKPVEEAAIKETLLHMDKSWTQLNLHGKKIIKIKTFGNFEVFLEDKPISFERTKAKELLAYLVDRNGATVTIAEIASVLWEDKPYNRNVKNQVNVIISSLKKNLKAVGVEHLVIKKWNSIAIDITEFKCDMYEFTNGDIGAINSYQGEYMTNYSWAEFTNAQLNYRKYNM